MEFTLTTLKSLRWLVTFLQPFIVFLTGVITFWLLIRTRPRRLKALAVEKKTVIVNWTGHPLPQADWIGDTKVWAPDQPPYFNTTSWNALRDSVHKMFTCLPQDIQARLLKGDPHIIIAIPQLAAGLSVLLAVLHGKTGTFPTITCPLRSKDGGFELPQPINLGDVRLSVREDREMGEIGE